MHAESKGTTALTWKVKRGMSDIVWVNLISFSKLGTCTS